MKRATINDVAKLAGVSIKTVSRVLNHEPKVRPATRERIEAAIGELNYRPNSSARMLAGRRTYLIGLIYNASSSYMTTIQGGVLEACNGEHYDLLIHPCDYTDPAILEQVRELVTAPRVDGLLLVPPVSDLAAVRSLVQELGVPNVLISREAASDDEWTVCTNDRDVSAAVVAHLAGLGHRRIAFMRGHPDHIAMANRYDGYLDGMRDAYLDAPDTLIVQGENSFVSGKACATQLLQMALPPSAVFCANDHMAAGTMHVAHEFGMSIPGDVSIVGFDDIPLASQIWPPLTTVRQPLHEMARQSAAMLIDRLRGNRPDEINRVVEAELVVRSSTAPPKHLD